MFRNYQMNQPNPQQDKLNQLITEFQEEYGNCMDWIFAELNEPENLGYSQNLIDLFKPYGVSVMSGSVKPPILHVIFWFWNGPKFFDKDARRIKKFENRMRPKKLALEYLPGGIVEMFPLKLQIQNLMYYRGFMICYFWLERLYYISAGRNLGYEDALNIYFGGIIEKIVLRLDEFDKLDSIPEADCEFFHKLREVKVSEDAEKFKDRTGRILQTALKFNEFKGYLLFKESEDPFLDCLAAFSSVNSSKTNIVIDDYINAFKTYYKLLQTDLTQYKCQKGLFNDEYHGYIVCESCGSFYELKRGEKPDDFSSCHCGGKVKYVKYLKDGRKINWKSVVIYSILFFLILVMTFKIVNLLYFMIVGILFIILTLGPTSIIDEPDKRGSVLGTSVTIILSFLLSSLVIKLYFNDSGNYMVFFIPMCLILALNLVIILKRRLY